MGFGLGVLRLSSEAFWTLSPRELHAAARGLYGEGSASADRAALEAMMAAFPDV